MDVLSGVRDNWFTFAASTLLVFAATCSGSTEDKLRGGPTPSPPGAAAHFVELKDGDSVPTKVTVRFGLREMGVAPAGLDRANSGHHHLLIDTDLPPLNEPIPNDFNHLHLRKSAEELVALRPEAIQPGENDHRQQEEYDDKIGELLEHIVMTGFVALGESQPDVIDERAADPAKTGK